MGSTRSITRVWDIGIVDRLCRLKLDLEAAVEDANEEVYSFQIQRSLIYLKFVGGCRISHTISESYQKSTFYQKSFLRRDYTIKSLHAQPCLSLSSEAFIKYLQKQLHTLVLEQTPPQLSHGTPKFLQNCLSLKPT